MSDLIERPEIDLAPPEESAEEPPPFFRTWRRAYVAILLHLAFWIVLLYLFTVHFAS